MPRTPSQTELDTICRAIGAFPTGASVEEIASVLDADIPRRTLQRRLALLVEKRRLVSVGRGRGCRYLTPEHGHNKGAQRPVANRDEALKVLSRLKPELAEKFGVTRLALFGSTARNEARADSDVDVVVDFDGPATSERYFGVQFLLEDQLGRPVDLVSNKALRPELRPYIEQEAINV
ncbi:nucleotidyltransferase family protein [Thioalkalivibrio sulfidiphilus]|uniref:nucleotidyltransferase family protein n=1 Tax=Thioalkalivibrio sulfidiphilus TaxID=1033854 RepID=UPI0003A5ABFB